MAGEAELMEKTVVRPSQHVGFPTAALDLAGMGRHQGLRDGGAEQVDYASGCRGAGAMHAGDDDARTAARG